MGTAATPALVKPETKAEPAGFELKSTTAPAMPERESSAEPATQGLESTAAPVSVELETAGTFAVVELKVAAMPSAHDLETGAALGSVELETAAEAAHALKLEAAPFERTEPASPDLDASPPGSNVSDETPVFTLDAKGLQGNLLLGTTTLVWSLAISHWKMWYSSMIDGSCLNLS